MNRHGILVTPALALLACASSNRTVPHEMSAEAHEAAAARERRAAIEERGRYDPGAWQGRDCGGIELGRLRPVCWSEPRNATAHHLEEARRLDALAERHRAASEALRQAEARACADVAPADRDQSPLRHREDVLAVEPLYDHGRLAGAAVVFRAVPGLSAEALAKIGACHAARSAVLGHDRPESSWCPLAVPEIRVDSAERPDGVVLLVWSSDESRADEILRRASAVLDGGAGHPLR